MYSFVNTPNIILNIQSVRETCTKNPAIITDIPHIEIYAQHVVCLSRACEELSTLFHV